MRLLALKTILVASDLTETSDAALRAASALSSASGSGLHVVHVAGGVVAETGRRAEYRQELELSLARVGLQAKEARVHVVPGDPAVSIGKLADELSASVIVLGRRRDHQLGVAHERPLGGTAYAVLLRARTPCLAITDDLRLPIRRAVVAVDSSTTSRGALVVALSWTSALRSREPDGPVLTALHVERGAGASEQHARMKKDLSQELGALERSAGSWASVEVKSVTLPHDDPAECIARFVCEQDADMVFLGTRGLGDDGAGGLGSVAAKVTSSLTTAVLLVPPALWRDYARPIDSF